MVVNYYCVPGTVLSALYVFSPERYRFKSERETYSSFYCAHVEIRVEKLVHVMQSENGGAGSRPDTLNGGTMPLCTIGYVL